eukprot:TRINITY_DN69640_c0_g1_i1.p1 TRINITY_DN69640_c0_g1~~TRINITY_DN69640_c0_g1_i1.p1  ORF type:complete len:284 (+),score=45.17 TRINITY_DN69640_c0_g1_i1:629-1480(+)
MVAEVALTSEEAVACRTRSPDCRLLFANMAFGRNEIPAFVQRLKPFGDVVFVSTAGATPRIGLPRAVQAAASDASCSCPAHCRPVHALGRLDVVLPWSISHNSSGTAATSQRALGGKRPTLAYFIGSNTSCSRAELFARWANPQVHLQYGLFVSPTLVSSREFSSWSKRSKFCLVVDGHWPSTTRLADVIAHGCVPVVISNRVELPFDDLIDWSKVVLLLRESDLADLPQLLLTSVASLPELRRHLPDAAQALDYYHVRFQVLLLAALSHVRERAGRIGSEAV